MGNQHSFEKFDRFEELPKPVLQEILLKLERQQLHAICSISRKAFSICSLDNFREMYNKIHERQMIYGDLRLVSSTLTGDQYDGEYNLAFLDDMDSRILIKFSEIFVLKVLSYYGNSSPNGKNITFHYKSRTVVWLGAPYTKDELLIRLTEIGKENWINEFKFNKYSNKFTFPKTVADEIWKIIKKETSKKVSLIQEISLH